MSAGDADAVVRGFSQAVEALKSDNLIPGNVHGTIMPNGDYFVNGVWIENLFKYLY